MQLYRIAKSNYINDLNGTGAKMYGGRWNRPGIPVLYTSQHISLSILELIVNFSSQAALSFDYSVATIEIPESKIYTPTPSELPDNWIKYNNTECWEMTEQLFHKKNQWAIKLPSVIVPQEYNVIINPLHKSHNSKILIKTEKFQLDYRLPIINK
jgi:RES domain-containing protein